MRLRFIVDYWQSKHLAFFIRLTHKYLCYIKSIVKAPRDMRCPSSSVRPRAEAPRLPTRTKHDQDRTFSRRTSRASLRAPAAGAHTEGRKEETTKTCLDYTFPWNEGQWKSKWGKALLLVWADLQVIGTALTRRTRRIHALYSRMEPSSAEF